MWLHQETFNSNKRGTEEGSSRNEMWHQTNDEIGIAIQSWLWVRVELIAW